MRPSAMYRRPAADAAGRFASRPRSPRLFRSQSRAGRSAQLEARSAADRPRPDRLRRRARRSRRRLGDERARVDRPAVRAREDRRDPRHRQHLAARARDRVPAPAERDVDALHDRRLQGRRLHGGDSANAKSGACEARVLHRRSVSGRCRLRTRSSARCGRTCLGRRARRARIRRRCGRRDQHAIHVGHDGLSQGRHALEPEHRQQRLLGRRGARLHAGGSPVPVRAAVPLLRLRARRPRRLHAWRLSVPARILRRHPRARDRRSREVHGALRRADDVPRRARASRVRSLRHLVAADRHHGRRACARSR